MLSGTVIRSPGAGLAALVIVSLNCSPKNDNGVTDGTGESSAGEATLNVPTTGELPQFCEVSDAPDETSFPAVIADAICVRKAECGCVAHDDVECRKLVSGYFELVRSDAKVNGLVFDSVCVSQRLQEFAEVGCNRSEFSDFIERRTCGRCYFYTGSVQTNGACAAPKRPIYNECAAADEACRSVSPTCLPSAGIGGACLGTEDCELGLACSDQGVCLAASVGEPCVFTGLLGEQCGLGLWCDKDLCRKRRGVGAPCFQSVECETGRCDEGFCVDYLFACDFSMYMF